MSKNPLGQKHVLQESNENFSQLARRVGRRRVIVTIIVVLVTVLGTVAVFNYREAVISTKPPIVFSRQGVDNGQTITDIYYSLGFKQVFYQSNYGPNYVQRFWPWQKVDVNPHALTAEEYKQLTAQLDKKFSSKTGYDEYFDVFQTYDATILDVVKQDDAWTIYMKGAIYPFVSFENEVFPLWFSGTPQQPLIVEAVCKDNNLKVKDVKTYQLGDGNSHAIYENFPKPVAIRLNTYVKGPMDTGEKAEGRSKLKAAAHFGKTLAEEKRLEFSSNTGVVEVYYEGLIPWKETGASEEDLNQPPLVKKTLKKIKE